MNKKSREFIQLEWECPGCKARNPGPEQSCQSCGAPQPDNVAFVAPAERKFIRDEKSIERAKAGADIYCAFCETRNLATATECIQCGADLSEGEKRKAGEEVKRRVAEKKIICENCKAENPSSRGTCAECGAPLKKDEVVSAASSAKGISSTQAQIKSVPKRNWIIGLVLLLICCCVGAGLFFALSPSESVAGRVGQVYWQTSVPVQEEREVHYSDRIGSPPSDAYDISCHTESDEVCTERTVDQGNGYAEVVQDCKTQRDEYCSYSVLEWQTVETITLDGYDLNPEYANPALNYGQRLGSEDVAYSVSFSTDSGQLEYSPSDLAEFTQFQVGSQWKLTLNRLGGIISVER